MKIISISSCLSCPYLFKQFNLSFVIKYVCNNSQRKLNNIKEIPEWCLLKDLDE